MQTGDPAASPSGRSAAYDPAAGRNSASRSIADSGYTSQENIVTMDTEDRATDEEDISSSMAEPREPKQVRETSSSSADSDSPTKSLINDIVAASRLTKSNSTASNGTARSIPVIGSTPLGKLRVHQAPSTPNSTASSVTANSDSPAQAGAVASPTSQVYPTREPPKCLEAGDCFLLLDLPAKFTLGLDTIALTADGKNFLGFRDIPPGPHFLWISEPGAVSRCGYWFVTGEQGEVRIKQWDRYNEMLGEAASHFEAREHTNNIEKTYPRLIPHNFKGAGAQSVSLPNPSPPDRPQSRRGSIPDPDFTTDSLAIWDKLSSAITPRFLDRVTGKKNVSDWLVDTADGARGEIHFQESSKLLKTMVGSQLDFLFQQDIIDLRLLNIAAGDYSENDTTSRILAVLNNANPGTKRSSQSSLSTDPSTPSHRITESDILAEFQFAFLTGLHLGNYTCIEQWWHLLLKIILCAHQLVLLRPELVTSILQTLHAQLVYNDRYIDHAVDPPSTSTDPYQPPTSAPAAGTAATTTTTIYTCASVLDTIPRNKGKLRRALTSYKRHLNRALLSRKNDITPQQTGVGQAFADLEAWFWRYGWDLRSDYSKEEEKEEQQGNTEKKSGTGGVDAASTAKARMAMAMGIRGEGDDGEDEDPDSDEESGEYAPVFVELDDDGREVGLVNWNAD